VRFYQTDGSAQFHPGISSRANSEFDHGAREIVTGRLAAPADMSCKERLDDGFERAASFEPAVQCAARRGETRTRSKLFCSPLSASMLQRRMASGRSDGRRVTAV
jgi:hypothetical protein